jgi:hypothetical protein
MAVGCLRFRVVEPPLFVVCMAVGCLRFRVVEPNRQVPEINDNVHKEVTLQPQSDEDERINQQMYHVERFLGKKTIKGHVHYKCKWSDI